jgi:hypothetical protein
MRVALHDAASWMLCTVPLDNVPAMKRASPLQRFGAVLPFLMAAAAVAPALAQSSGLARGIAPLQRKAALASDAGSRQYLIDARIDLHDNQTAGAKEALERAETRLLGQEPASVTQGAHPRLLRATLLARQALAAHDTQRAAEILDTVLAVRVADVAPEVMLELAYPPPERMRR